jgi:hypothetical protein
MQKISDKLYSCGEIKIAFHEDEDQGRWFALTQNDEIVRGRHFIPISGNSPEQVAMRLKKINK